MLTVKGGHGGAAAAVADEGVSSRFPALNLLINFLTNNDPAMFLGDSDLIQSVANFFKKDEEFSNSKALDFLEGLIADHLGKLKDSNNPHQHRVLIEAFSAVVLGNIITDSFFDAMSKKLKVRLKENLNRAGLELQSDPYLLARLMLCLLAFVVNQVISKAAPKPIYLSHFYNALLELIFLIDDPRPGSLVERIPLSELNAKFLAALDKESGLVNQSASLTAPSISSWINEQDFLSTMRLTEDNVYHEQRTRQVPDLPLYLAQSFCLGAQEPSQSLKLVIRSPRADILELLAVLVIDHHPDDSSKLHVMRVDRDHRLRDCTADNWLHDLSQRDCAPLLIITKNGDNIFMTWDITSADLGQVYLAQIPRAKSSSTTCTLNADGHLCERVEGTPDELLHVLQRSVGLASQGFSAIQLISRPSSDSQGFEVTALLVHALPDHLRHSGAVEVMGFAYSVKMLCANPKGELGNFPEYVGTTGICQIRPNEIKWLINSASLSTLVCSVEIVRPAWVTSFMPEYQAEEDVAESVLARVYNARLRVFQNSRPDSPEYHLALAALAQLLKDSNLRSLVALEKKLYHSSSRQAVGRADDTTPLLVQGENSQFALVPELGVAGRFYRLLIAPGMFVPAFDQPNSLERFRKRFFLFLSLITSVLPWVLAEFSFEPGKYGKVVYGKDVAKQMGRDRAAALCLLGFMSFGMLIEFIVFPLGAKLRQVLKFGNLRHDAPIMELLGKVFEQNLIGVFAKLAILPVPADPDDSELRSLIKCYKEQVAFSTGIGNRLSRELGNSFFPRAPNNPREAAAMGLVQGYREDQANQQENESLLATWNLWSLLLKLPVVGLMLFFIIHFQQDIDKIDDAKAIGAFETGYIEDNNLFVSTSFAAVGGLAISLIVDEVAYQISESRNGRGFFCCKPKARPEPLQAVVVNDSPGLVTN